MDTSKEEIVNLRKQINRLKISLMFTQVLMIALLLILGYQCLWSIWNYHYLLQQISMCLDSVNTVYSALQQFFATLPRIIPIIPGKKMIIPGKMT